MSYYFITYFYNPDERDCTSIRVSVQQSDPLLLDNHVFFTLIPVWIHDYIHHKVYNEIAYPYPNFISKIAPPYTNFSQLCVIYVREDNDSNV